MLLKYLIKKMVMQITIFFIKAIYNIFVLSSINSTYEDIFSSTL
jgi:hypothetical protein